MERRATPRFPMKLPMRVRWATKSGNREAQTESEDISSRGVYFILPTRIRAGSWVELVLVLPHEITLAEPALVRCQARMRRTEIKKRNRVGVAAEIEIYQVLREAQGVAVKRTPKWGSLSERFLKLQDGESIVLECYGNAADEAQKIRNGLNGIAACILVQRSVKVVDGKIVITRVGTWRPPVLRHDVPTRVV